MKCVINPSYYVFNIPNDLHEKLKNKYDESNRHLMRTDKHFVNWVESHKNETSLKTVDIPDNVSDYEITEYDGYESVTAVLNGKIIHIYYEHN